MKTALITGITGQDGSYLAELLLSMGYDVHGLVRRTSSINRYRIDQLSRDPLVADRIHLHYGDVTDGLALTSLLKWLQPDEIYNLAAQSHVKVSFELPEYTANVDALGALRILEAMRISCPGARFYQASSSEMFGSAAPPQCETTVFKPRSPYAAAKLFAHWTTVNYREAYGLWTASGILFNHESPRRGENFVTRKISLAVAKIRLGVQEKLHLGNLGAIRDWGYAPEYVKGMWLMLQQDEPSDFVLGTGTRRTVEQFCAVAFEHAGLTWQDHVVTDRDYERPTEVSALVGDARHAATALGWKAETHADELARLMVDEDTRQMERLLRP